jgi:hypothetical protein
MLTKSMEKHIGDDGTRSADGVDRALDLAVREMLDVEPRADLRARVIERIQRPHRVFNWTWVIVPIAAAAVLVLAIVLRKPAEPRATRPRTDIVLNAPRTSKPVKIAHRDEPGRPPSRVASPRERRATAAIAAADTDVNTRPAAEFAVVDALAPPPPIVLEQISSTGTRPVVKLDVAPLQLSALEMNALQDSPRERREE